jgi:hypothetical protein
MQRSLLHNSCVGPLRLCGQTRRESRENAQDTSTLDVLNPVNSYVFLLFKSRSLDFVTCSAPYFYNNYYIIMLCVHYIRLLLRSTKRGLI